MSKYGEKIMTILPLIISPDPLLNKISQPVEKVDEKLQKFMKDMLETMYQEAGIGLAAVQVGVLKRVLVMDVEYVADCDDHGCGHHHAPKSPKPIFMVNPVITKTSKETSHFLEGCLSFPEFRTDIARPKEVTVEYLDYHGDKQILKAEGLLATCVQHEIDHLDGITLVNHLSQLKREMVLKKMKKRNHAAV
jgi:peptide deformylase